MERGDATAVRRDNDETEEVGEASMGAAKLLERVHEAERALDDQKRRQAGRLVRRRLRIYKWYFQTHWDRMGRLWSPDRG